MAGLRVDITGDGSGLSRALGKSQGEVRQWASSVKNQIMGAFSAAAITAAFKSTISNIQGVGDAAMRMDIPIEQMEALQNIALLAGRDLGKVEAILNRIGDAKTAALGGDADKLNLFKQMGIGLGDLSNLNDAKLWERMSIGTSGMDMSQKRGVLTDIVGKQGVGTFNSMNEDMSGFTGTLSRWLENNTILSEKMILSHKQSADELDVAWKQLTNSVLKDLLPVIVTFNKALTGVINGLWFLDKVLRIQKFGPLFEKLNDWLTKLRNQNEPKKNPLPINQVHTDGDLVSTLTETPTEKRNNDKSSLPVKSPKEIYSDALLSIGNFMGQGFNGMSQATTLVDEARKQTKILRESKNELLKLNKTMYDALKDGSIIIP